MTLTRKSPDAFRTISEVSEILEVPAHVLRFWETRFSQIRPVKRGGGRRYYRPQDIALLRGIRDLLYDDGMTIKGVQKILRERGVRHVTGLGQLAPEEDPLMQDAEAADGMEAPLEITAPAAQPIAETSVPEPAPLPEAEPRRPFPQIDMPATGGEPQETQIDLFAHAESQKRRPFPPDPARAKRAATLRGLLGKFIALREKMARDL